MANQFLIKETMAAMKDLSLKIIGRCSWFCSVACFFD